MKSNKEDWKNLIETIKRHHVILQDNRPVVRERKPDVDVDRLQTSIKTYGLYVIHYADINISLLIPITEHFIQFLWRSYKRAIFQNIKVLTTRESGNC